MSEPAEQHQQKMMLNGTPSSQRIMGMGYILCVVVVVRSYQRSLRSLPPSAAANDAASAPASSAMADHSATASAALRALSAASFACAMVWSTRFCASSGERPVRAATTCAA